MQANKNGNDKDVSDIARRMSNGIATISNRESITSSGGGTGTATACAIVRNRSPSKMTKYVECWGADKPFANITESTLAKNIGLTVSFL